MSQNGKAYEEDERARKRGLKEAALYRQRGDSGFLPVLDA